MNFDFMVICRNLDIFHCKFQPNQVKMQIFLVFKHFFPGFAGFPLKNVWKIQFSPKIHDFQLFLSILHWKFINFDFSLYFLHFPVQISAKPIRFRIYRASEQFLPDSWLRSKNYQFFTEFRAFPVQIQWKISWTSSFFNSIVTLFDANSVIFTQFSAFPCF